MNTLKKWLTTYWTWSTSGGIWRKVIGFGGAAFVALFVVAAVVGGGGDESRDADSIGADVGPTNGAEGAASPTETPVPTEPTATPEPTQAPSPTPTATHTPAPTPTPEPIVLQGAGDDVVSIDPGPAIMRIEGNAEARHFAISGYDSSGRSTGLFVNTTDPYSGTVALDFAARDQTVQLEITSIGSWTITILPVAASRVITAPGTISGTGDDVLVINSIDGQAGQGGTALIRGNAAGRHFAVIGWSDRSDLLVNTTDPYEGRVRVPPGTILLEVTAEGPWEITLER